MTWPSGTQVVRASTTKPVPPGTAPEFQAFLRAEVTRLNKATSSQLGCSADDFITVERYRTDGWASGSVTQGCTGSNDVGDASAAYWKNDGTKWTVVTMTESALDCAQVGRLGIPADLLPTCTLNGATVANPNG